MVTVYHYLILSAFLFSVGVLGVLARRNAVGILISIELILNAANINFLAFSRYGAKVLGIPTLSTPVALDGHVFAIFVIILAACEAAIALAIIINIFNSFGSIEVDSASTMRG
ncbi:MAG: NADH-quinone oxidoreductase subunit K [Candidatus Sumerlaea sp.]|uniref:NADH-quinone oxidoreductase subunit K n=1 Tax=Sumerlaea chitinivorans TaxID=2250252 RepID=A0A2Z4Y6S2_SUMC1|nr:NADH-ubiquinone oxidoreductase chain K [Candidatus Sumerlaea chitinivorans]GIX45651.1 MAG: NADH-quinone oxidoreductase subunit K [Candidatus Sumerlaea sp.]